MIMSCMISGFRHEPVFFSPLSSGLLKAPQLLQILGEPLGRIDSVGMGPS